ncbi:rhamnulokinase [Granulicella rosea]|uniref:Rhamnulokinase n=1 Tax=Granulicella rosea TaxID=474952 RepID=A0A239M594_9BACT|nr:FGGY-family carbohydrate kinase [Granulicella rosea]SNT37049.1 rhamnulokinase [Granulicella rosea]
MKKALEKALAPKDVRASIAVDLGAESCRVSLLRWEGTRPVITLVHRFPNAPRELPEEQGGGLRWDLSMIVHGLEHGLRLCAGLATEGVRSIAVDGWAVDYVRVDADGAALADPFCYRDERTIKAERSLHRKARPERMRELTGIQLMRINTLYQLHADALAELPEGQQWLNLPEYILSRWGGARVAEFTNATHTQLVELHKRQWCREIFSAAQLDMACAPKLVPPGTEVGRLSGPLAELPAFADTVLVAPACHDTASAIAGIPAQGNDWAYISSGTWSLVGTLLEQPRNGHAPSAENFTNLGAVGDRVCFHKNVNGMWLIKQCMEQWASEGTDWNIVDLVAAAEKLPRPHDLLDVDDPELLLPERMPQRINAQRVKRGHDPLDESASNAPAFASLIFYSLAARYAKVLDRISLHSGKQFKRLFIVGGASQNLFLNRLTAEATGLEVFRGAPESSTVGNFAVQLAALEGSRDAITGVYAEPVARWAALMEGALEAGAKG